MQTCHQNVWSFQSQPNKRRECSSCLQCSLARGSTSLSWRNIVLPDQRSIDEWAERSGQVFHLQAEKNSALTFCIYQPNRYAFFCLFVCIDLASDDEDLNSPHHDRMSLCDTGAVQHQSSWAHLGKKSTDRPSGERSKYLVWGKKKKSYYGISKTHLILFA